MSDSTQSAGSANPPQSLDWEAFRHHRQAYLDRRQIAALKAIWEVRPEGVDESAPNDSSAIADDDSQDWMLLSY